LESNVDPLTVLLFDVLLDVDANFGLDAHSNIRHWNCHLVLN